MTCFDGRKGPSGGKRLAYLLHGIPSDAYLRFLFRFSSSRTPPTIDRQYVQVFGFLRELYNPFMGAADPTAELLYQAAVQEQSISIAEPAPLEKVTAGPKRLKNEKGEKRKENTQIPQTHKSPLQTPLVILQCFKYY